MIKQLVVVLGGRVCVSFGFKVRFYPLQGDNSDIHIYFAGFCSVLDEITGHSYFIHYHNKTNSARYG